MALYLFLMSFLITGLAPPQSSTASNIAPGDLVRRVVQHELKADNDDHTHWIYKDTVKIPAPPKEKTVIETPNGNLACLEQIDNHPLTPEQRSAEAQRIRAFVSDAGAQRKAQKASLADDRKSAELFAMLPDGFTFKTAETNGDQTKLTFEPNPAYHTHSMEQYVFHHMTGFVVLNTHEDRLVEISGRLPRGVEFGGGLLGRLDSGGTFDVQLTNVAPSVWKISRLKINMHGRLLFFKTIGDQQDETRSDFRKVPDGLSFTEAENMLMKQDGEANARK